MEARHIVDEVKIAIGQITCAVGEITANLDKMRAFSGRARDEGAAWIVFPEMSDTGYVMSVVKERAGNWNEGAVRALRAIAREMALGIIAGVSERDPEHIYNSQVAIDAQGEIVAKYRKMHLYAPAPVEEHKVFAAGNEVVSFATGDFRIGLGICYDLRFPELFRKLAIEEKTNVFVLSSAWPSKRPKHLRALAIARAIENQSYFVISNRVGRDGDGVFCGGSAVIDPMGEIVAEAGVENDDVIFAEIARTEIESFRTRMAVFEHRRL